MANCPNCGARASESAKFCSRCGHTPDGTLEQTSEHKRTSILKLGAYSPYWDEYVRGLPWDRDSAETKLYLASKLCGFAHDEVLRMLTQQSRKHGSNFRNQGFFIWKEFFQSMK